jgi:anti-sigma factor RsiW
MNRLAHPIPGEWLTAYYDDELEPARRAQVVAHLPECADCRRELDELRALSLALAAGALPQAALTAPGAFWRGVQQQLPERQPAPAVGAELNAGRVLLGWAPGIGLLLLNGLVQVAAAAGTLFLLTTGSLAATPTWAVWIERLAAGASLGWLAWLLPGGWGGVGLGLFWLTVSGALALLYLAWLAYEWRYGTAARVARATA